MLDVLEENRRHLKTETEIQKKKNQDIENVKRGLEEELRTYRQASRVKAPSRGHVNLHRLTRHVPQNYFFSL